MRKIERLLETKRLEKRLTKSALCREAKISRNRYLAMIMGRARISLYLVGRVALVLGIPPGELGEAILEDARREDIHE